MVKHYNDQFARATINEYYIPPILARDRNHGNFDGTYYGMENEEEEDDSYEHSKKGGKSGKGGYVNRQKSESVPSTGTEHKAYKMAINDEPIRKGYGLQRKTSYHEQPVYNSDLGISEIDDVFSSENKQEEDYHNHPDIDPDEEQKYPSTSFVSIY